MRAKSIMKDGRRCRLLNGFVDAWGWKSMPNAIDSLPERLALGAHYHKARLGIDLRRVNRKGNTCEFFLIRERIAWRMTKMDVLSNEKEKDANSRQKKD